MFPYNADMSPFRETPGTARRGPAPLPEIPSESHAPEIGARLRDARRRARMSLRELAGKGGMSIGQLSKIETGKKPVSLRHFDTIRKALGVPLSAIFPDAESRYVITRREAIARQLSEL